jgi:hypothetical protein
MRHSTRLSVAAVKLSKKLSTKVKEQKADCDEFMAERRSWKGRARPHQRVLPSVARCSARARTLSDSSSSRMHCRLSDSLKRPRQLNAWLNAASAARAVSLCEAKTCERRPAAHPLPAGLTAQVAHAKRRVHRCLYALLDAACGQ